MLPIYETVKIECKNCCQIFKVYIAEEDYEMIQQDMKHVDDIDYLSDEEKILLKYQLCKDCYDEDNL